MYRCSTLFHSSFEQKVRAAVCIFYLTLGLFGVVGAVYGKVGSQPSDNGELLRATNALAAYDWNLKQTQRPLLNLPDQLNGAFDLSLAYPALTYSISRLRFPLSQTLEFDSASRSYVLILSDKTKVEFKEAGTSGRYISTDSSFVSLLDNHGVKTLRARNTEYTFIRFNDGATRCIRIKDAEGSIITIVYSKDNLIHNIVDSAGRTITFNYRDDRIGSVTQTWTANSVAVSRTWTMGNDQSQIKLAHASRNRSIVGAVAAVPVNIAGTVKPIPNNAVWSEYTPAMISSDRQLAEIFGGPGAVAAANGFEPERLADQYPLYRGDLTASDGRLLRGHLSYAMHLYGNEEGTGESALYVPAGFTSHSSEPSPTDAAVTFFYPRLGNFTNVTLAVFHVANFTLGPGTGRGTGVSPVGRAPENDHAITAANGRIRIGSIGGPGGSCSIYKHSHIEFYRGDVGLPSASAREQLRIDPAAVFGLNSTIATRTRSATARRSE